MVLEQPGSDGNFLEPHESLGAATVLTLSAGLELGRLSCRKVWLRAMLVIVFGRSVLFLVFNLTTDAAQVVGSSKRPETST